MILGATSGLLHHRPPGGCAPSRRGQTGLAGAWGQGQEAIAVPDAGAMVG